MAWSHLATHVTTKEIKVGYLARVEGEGSLYLKFEGNQVKDVQLKIFEPPRFFEGFLCGRAFTEVTDITARICGICPVAYQMSSAHAMEDACGLIVSEPIAQMRRLLYCAEFSGSQIGGGERVRNHRSAAWMSISQA